MIWGGREMSMTENEAISLIENLKFLSSEDTYRKHIDAIKMAIQALEEIQQYRAIGTVEGYKRVIEISKENFRVSMEYKAKVQEYEAIGTIDEFKAWKEKQKYCLGYRLENGIKSPQFD